MARPARLKPLAGVALLAAALPAFAQAPPRPLSIDAIYEPGTRADFNGSPATDITWLDENTYLLKERTSGGEYDWTQADAVSGRSTPLFDAAKMTAALASLPGVTAAEAAQRARSRDLILSPSHSSVLLTIAGDLYFYDFSSSRAVRLTAVPGDEEEPSFSPDGRLVAFTRANNLFVVDVASQRERALTTDGSAEILNGKLDWLYQEEIYGRGNFRGFWWSPDSARVAFLRLDERPVPKYTIVDQIPYRPTVEIESYPKAGDPNPLVTLGVVRVSDRAPLWLDLDRTSTNDLLVVNVGWTPDAETVVYQVQNREQTWLDLNFANADSGRTRRILRETTQAWVNENGSPTWLKDGSFLWASERSGFRHLYRYRADGTQIRQVTSGRWDVRPLYGVDEANGLVYFASNERSAIGTDIYRIELDGSGMTRLSRAPGTHRALFNARLTRYVDIWSDITTPRQVRLHAADGSELRVIDANRVSALAEYRLARPEFVQVTTRDGVTMDAMMIKPPDFDPARRYPVFQHTYAGPGLQQVRNEWGGSTYLFHQLIAQHGVIVWVLDNRSAGGRGVESQWPIYGRLGELELRDLEDGISWLKQQRYVDASRIVIEGWSYGGFMTTYALTHSASWAGGIAGGPVTDWRNYDTVYTERYMKTPEHNAEGYRATAPRFAAEHLQGRLLIVHGTIDDNVHFQNSEQFVYELQKAGKSFELMVYPKSRHGVADPRLNQHLHQTVLDFVLRTVRTESKESRATASQ